MKTLMEYSRRFKNFRIYMSFAFLALKTNSVAFSLAILAAHRSENDAIIKQVVANDELISIETGYENDEKYKEYHFKKDSGKNNQARSGH